MNTHIDQIPTPSQLKTLIGGRAVHIWGARHDGYAAYHVLNRHGIDIQAFIDSSLALQGQRVFGKDIQLPEPFFATETPQTAFILIASGFHADAIVQDCQRHGFQVGRDVVIQGDLRLFNYQVDIAGSCNLRCISCPRGNFDSHRPKGFMSAETYRALLDKILRDDPYTGIITLYNWGEPLLNRELPEILALTHSRGLLSALSSNLSFKLDFEPVIAARPTWFRISVSGWGERYEITHTGGNWARLMENIRRLAEYRDRHHPGMLVEVFYHLYNDNRDDIHRWQALCDELGFMLRYRHAALAPLDNIEAILEGRAVNERVRRTMALQQLQVGEVMELALAERHRPCYYERHLWINWNLEVAHCMEWYRPDLNLVPGSFMDTTPEQLIAAREASEFCMRCKERGIHRCFIVYSDERLIIERDSLPLAAGAA